MFQNFRGNPITSFFKASDLENDEGGLSMEYVSLVFFFNCYPDCTCFSRITAILKFEQGGKDGRYVSFARISPGKLTTIKISSNDYVALKTMDPSHPKVAVGLNFGCVEWSNLTTGAPRFNNERKKKAIDLLQLGGMAVREQSCICTVLSLDDSPVVQAGSDYLQFSTKLADGERIIRVITLIHADL